MKKLISNICLNILFVLILSGTVCANAYYPERDGKEGDTLENQLYEMRTCEGLSRYIRFDKGCDTGWSLIFPETTVPRECLDEEAMIDLFTICPRLFIKI